MISLMTYEELLKHLKDNAAASAGAMTDDEANAFYWSKEWARKRKHVRKRDRDECVLCARHGRVTRKRLYVHHIKPLKGCYDLRLDDDNLITLCYACHELVHNRQPIRREQLRPEWW